MGAGKQARRPRKMTGSPYKKVIGELYQIPEFIKELMEIRLELQKQLYNCSDNETAKIKENLSATDRDLEWLRGRQQAAVATVNLIAALT
ncbi:MAG: hypothetical protein K6U74_04475, partial [Firmicutes bacterium]|nr:hypothetical protein [Bacillota bacterium]